MEVNIFMYIYLYVYFFNDIEFCEIIYRIDYIKWNSISNIDFWKIVLKSYYTYNA